MMAWVLNKAIQRELVREATRGGHRLLRSEINLSMRAVLQSDEFQRTRQDTSGRLTGQNKECTRGWLLPKMRSLP